MKQHCLVTGGMGFIGSHIVDALIAEGHKVSVVDNVSTGRRQNQNLKADFIEADITDAQISNKIAQLKPQIIFHLAAQIDVRKSISHPDFNHQINVGGSLNILNAAQEAGVGKFIFSSTGGAIYGETDILPTPESAPALPLSPYGESKLEIDLEMQKRVSSGSKMKMISLRYGNVYGPRQDPLGEAGVISIFSAAILSNRKFFINGDGLQTRDYVFVADVVKANLLAMHQADSGIYNVGTGIETNVLEIVEAIKIAAHKDQLILEHRAAIPGEVKRSVLDTRKIQNELGWKPTEKLGSGIQKLVDSLKIDSL